MTLVALLRTFRRHYLWASDVHRTLCNLGPLSLQIRANKIDDDQFEVQAENLLPDQEFTTRLAVLMYPLLDPESETYWEHIVTALETHFRDEIPQALRDRVDAHAHRLANIRAIPIQFNNELLDPQRVYLQLAKGSYFGRNPQAQVELQELLAAPFMEPLLWHSFYDYTVNGFGLMSALYDIVLALRDTDAFQELLREQPTGPGRCIYCMRTDATFTSEEHVLPEGLGNDELVLRQGYVCDVCNHGDLAMLDDILLGFPPIAVFKTVYVPHTKGGRLPSANLQNMTIRKTTPTRVEILAKDTSGLPRQEEELGDGTIRFTVTTRGGTSDMTLIARAYFKIALGTIAYDCGADFALEQRYDRARAFIRGEREFPNPLILNRKGEPHGRIEVTWQKLEPGTAFHIDIFGLIAVFNLEAEPLIHLPVNFDGSTFIVLDLKKTDGEGTYV
jgi:hypothetical protein